MTLRIAPLTSRIRQRLPGAEPLEAFATDTVVLQPAEVQPLARAVYPPGELELITGVHEFSAGLNDELQLTTCETVRHTETLAWRLENVCVTRGRLCNLRSYRLLTYGRASSAPADLRDITDTVAFCSTAAGNDYFAHLLLDDASTALLGADFGRVLFGGGMRAPTTHARDYLQLFGIAAEYATDVRLREAWLFTDHAQNSHRRRRLRALRTALRNAVTASDAGTPPVYLRRGRGGTMRRLANEADVELALSRRGFRIVEPESLQATELSQLLANTPLVVGVEGSQLVHGLLNLAAGGGLLCIQPAARYNAVYRSFCHSLELRWGFVVAEGSPHEFSLSVDRLMHAIDLLAAQTGLPC